MDTNIRLLSE